MITLTRKKKDSGAGAIADKRISIREFLLVKEVQELEQNLPSTCKISFQDANVLSDFFLSIAPNEGFWQGGRFKFSVHVPEEYNMAVSDLQLVVKCFMLSKFRPKYKGQPIKYHGSCID